MHVLIIAHQGDGHVEIVTKHLTVPYTVIDTYDIRDGTPLSFRTIGGGKTSIVYQGKEISNATAVWCKRLAVDFQSAKYKIDKEYEEYCLTALRDFINSLTVSFEDAFWISPYQEMLRAVNKQYHLNVARQLGFAVPDTLITSDSEAAQEFINSRETTIVKPFTPKIATKENGGGKFFFAAKAKKGERLNLESLSIAPVIFQTAIDQVCDVRVFIVGKKLFAASITSEEQADSRHRDWRTAQFDGHMEVAAHELPKHVADKCLKLTKQMGLVYGAIDLLLDKTGKYWFLEINTTGAWRFVEDRTGQPIAAAMADLLNTAGKGL